MATTAKPEGKSARPIVLYPSNRCSGGARTIRRIVQEAYIPPGSTIVEIGSNTGYSTLEFGLLRPDCNVKGIDINRISVEKAQAKSDAHLLRHVEFLVGDGTGLDLTDQSVDLLFVSNVTSFIQRRKDAICEYDRVLKHLGYLAAVPIYYRQTPPIALKIAVEQAIGAELKNNSRSDWLRLFQENQPGSRLTFQEDYGYDDIAVADIQRYVDKVLQNSGHAGTSFGERLARRLMEFFVLFNENLKYCGFSIFLLQKTLANNEDELFTSHRLG